MNSAGWLPPYVPEFQFLIGRLAIALGIVLIFLINTFQFLIGRLAISNICVVRKPDHQFQFLIGRLAIDIFIWGRQLRFTVSIPHR